MLFSPSEPPKPPQEEELFSLRYLRDIVAFVGMLAGLVGMYVRQGYVRHTSRYGRLGAVGFLITSIAVVAPLAGALMVTLGLVPGAFHRLEAAPALFLGGGFVLLGADTLRARVLLPWWVGVVLLVGGLLMISWLFLLSVVGQIVGGITCLALGYGLWTQRDTPAPQEQRTS